MDEVYLKQEVDYRGGIFFGFDNHGKKARTLLFLLIKFEHGGPIIPFKYLPVHTLSQSDMMMLYSQTRDLLFKAGVNVLAVITDNNRTNQKFLNEIERIYPE